jgi:hypothetical protein
VPEQAFHILSKEVNGFGKGKLMQSYIKTYFLAKE